MCDNYKTAEIIINKKNVTCKMRNETNMVVLRNFCIKNENIQRPVNGKFAAWGVCDPRDLRGRERVNYVVSISL